MRNCSSTNILNAILMIAFSILLTVDAFTIKSLRHGRNNSVAASRPTEPSDLVSASTVSPLSLNLDDLSVFLKGKGRAQALWECYRKGIDPLENMSTDCSGIEFGQKAMLLLNSRFPGTIRETVSSHIHSKTSEDGTTKLLLQLAKDNLQVETVIIPWEERGKSTLCVSSQVGCAQACTFCMTGRMGKLRSLSADEILAQVFWANRVCREQNIYPIDNIVFMGMGEPADNPGAVVCATEIISDRQLFQLAPKRITISTVAPSTDAFASLGRAPAVLAWSLHSSRNDVRKKLVPTTQHTVEELRDALANVLLGRSRRLRATMLEVTLLDHVNDSIEDARHLAEFCQPLKAIPAVKLVVNLIPWNNISVDSGPAKSFRKPTMARVHAFQNELIAAGILCFVRTTRGDDENAACGQLATEKRTVKKE